jgi:hypothetical protein
MANYFMQNISRMRRQQSQHLTQSDGSRLEICVILMKIVDRLKELIKYKGYEINYICL